MSALKTCLAYCTHNHAHKRIHIKYKPEEDNRCDCQSLESDPYSTAFSMLFGNVTAE